MKISVIIPTYKPQDYLWECLDSLVNQTFPKDDFEVILVLNGCTEPWKSQIEDYIATKMQSMNVNFIHTEQGGVSNARNIALDKAKGEYITFIDDDDFVSPSYLEELYEKASPDTISLCYPYAFNDGKFEKQLSYKLTDVYNEYHIHENNNISSKVRKYFSGPWMKLIPISFIQDRRFDIHFKIGEDVLFMFLISDKYNKFIFTSNKAVYYRRYRENSAIKIKRNRRDIILNCLRGINEYCRIYLFHPTNYNFIFFITRVLGAIRGMFL